MGNINAVTNLSVADGIARITLDSPPVNALSFQVCEGLFRAFTQAIADPVVSGILLGCAGRTFIAGADISEFGREPSGPSFFDVMAAVGGSDKPIVAAIHGTALGGGLELALACHYRVATASTMVGLPEVALGLLPGAGGTQRLPRIVGAAKALEMIALGKPIKADEALQLGILDLVVGDAELDDAAFAFLLDKIATTAALPRVQDLRERTETDRARPEIFSAFRERHAEAFRGFKAPEHIIRAIEAAVAMPFAEGMKRETELFGELMASAESAAQRYLFFAERAIAKIPDLGADIPTLDIATMAILDDAPASIAVVGLLERAGLIKHTSPETADIIVLGGEASAGLLNRARNRPLVVCGDPAADPDRFPVPERTIVVHPIGRKLVEIGRGKATARPIVKTMLQLARRNGRLAVQVGAGNGLIVARLTEVLRQSVVRAVAHGWAQDEIDAALVDYGFRSSPFGGEGFPPSAGRGDTGLVAELLGPVAEEGTRLVASSEVLRESDIDVALVHGLGWPAYRGGPMHFAGEQGTESTSALPAEAS